MLESECIRFQGLPALNAMKHRNLFSGSYGGQKSEFRMAQSCAPSAGSREESLLGASKLPVVLAVLGTGWAVTALAQSLLTSLREDFLPLSFCLLSIKTPVIVFTSPTATPNIV